MSLLPASDSLSEILARTSWSMPAKAPQCPGFKNGVRPMSLNPAWFMPKTGLERVPFVLQSTHFLQHLSVTHLASSFATCLLRCSMNASSAQKVKLSKNARCPASVSHRSFPRESSFVAQMHKWLITLQSCWNMLGLSLTFSCTSKDLLYR